jgi:hypothetical protein
VIFVILPRLGAPTTLSASTILGRSLQTLSSSHGIELVEYELALSGMAQGPHRIEQLVDNEHPSRFRLANYDSAGILQSAISQDPFTGVRSHLIRVDGRNYVFHLTSAQTWLPSLPQVAQAQLEAVITMMQASSDPKLTVLDRSDGRWYVIQIPPVTPKAGVGVLDLYQARAVIDAGDFHLKEFEASGALLKQPYTVSFKVIRQSLRPATQVSPDEFEIQTAPGDVVLEGEATSDPMADVLGTVLKELGRSKGQ